MLFPVSRLADLITRRGDVDLIARKPTGGASSKFDQLLARDMRQDVDVLSLVIARYFSHPKIVDWEVSSPGGLSHVVQDAPISGRLFCGSQVVEPVDAHRYERVQGPASSIRHIPKVFEGPNIVARQGSDGSSFVHGLELYKSTRDGA